MKRQILFVIALCAFGCLHAQQTMYHDGEEKKVAEIASVITVNKMQRNAINEAFGRKRQKMKGLSEGLDAKGKAFRKYEIEKACHEELIRQLSDRQIAEYCEINFAPEVTEKTNYRMSLLTEVDNDYTDAELEEMRSDIYRYLMLEKIVYFRYKYDYAKQKENINRLKAIQPASMKAALNNEKQKSYGKVVSGNVQWRNHGRR